MNDGRSIGRCSADGGCDYLRSLALFERLAGFDLTARAFNGIAAQCEEEGCWRRSALAVATVAEVPAASSFQVLSAISRAKAAPAAASERIVGTANVIPFSRAAHLDVGSDGSGNWVEHRRLEAASLEPADSLGYLYGYWRSLSATTSCMLANVDVLHLIRARIIGKLHIVNVASSDPAQFTYELFGYAVPVENPGKPAAIAVAIWREKILRDYNTARLIGTPSLERIRAHLHGKNYHYTRLILPFFDRRRRTSHLAIAIRREAGDGCPVGVA
jgi:hypothetical protein